MANAREFAWLKDALTFTQGAGGMTKRVSMLKGAGKKWYFGGGFLRMLKRKAEEDGVELVIDDARTPPPPPHPVRAAYAHAVPRYYQTDAASIGIAATHGVIELPTGSGKTLVATMIADALRDMPVLYAVGDAVLADSMRATYERETGRTADRTLEGARSMVIVTLQSVYAALRKAPQRTIKALRRFRALIVDEAHGVPAETFYKVCSAVPAYYRIGLSATPFDRSDNRTAQIFAMFGGLIYRKTEGELAREGFLPKADINMVRYVQPSVFLGKYPKAYELQVVREQHRNALIADIVRGADKPCLVLFNAIEHGPRLAEELQDLHTVVVDGGAKVHQRKEIIRKMNAGVIDVAVASRVFSVGIDIPELRSVVIAGAGKSVVQTVQRVGRGMRMTSEKDSFQVWDVLDWTENYHLTRVKGAKTRGLWIAKHAHERLRTYRRRGHDVRVWEGLGGASKVYPGNLKGRAGRKDSIKSAARVVQPIGGSE